MKNPIPAYANNNLEAIVGNKLLNAGKTLSIAESCTGGLLADRITDIPGSSRYFKLSVVPYSNKSKIKILGIPPGVIKKYGAVSEETSISMAKNIRRLGETDIGIGISGISGPGGATKKKPIGLVYIAISSKMKNSCTEFRFHGNRRTIKYKAIHEALNMLRLHL